METWKTFDFTRNKDIKTENGLHLAGDIRSQLISYLKANNCLDYKTIIYSLLYALEEYTDARLQTPEERQENLSAKVEAIENRGYISSNEKSKIQKHSKLTYTTYCEDYFNPEKREDPQSYSVHQVMETPFDVDYSKLTPVQQEAYKEALLESMWKKLKPLILTEVENQ